MVGPREVSPVTLDGIRYEAVHWGKPRGLAQNGGYVAAIGPDGEELWLQQIYEIVYGDKSPQKYDVFITKLEPVEGGTALRITDESGRVFRLNLDDRSVRLIAEPVTAPPKPNPAKPPRLDQN